MLIHKSSTVEDIFDQFNQMFPYLKLEFYQKSHEDSEGSRADEIISHQTHLVKLNPHLKEAEFNIDGEMSVAGFEQYMKDKFGLNVQVFRKSADLWLQTTATDHWTLAKQNGKGQRSTVDYDIDSIDITDFDVE